MNYELRGDSHFSIVVIACMLPFILWGVCGIMPTFDDYTTLQSTWYIQISDPGYFFPDAVRRPWDFLFGCLLGYFPSLFPTLNHVCIILGHAASACLVYALCRKLSLGSLAANIATLFFFLSPATLGATLACDGLNQTYAQLWGLLALWTYRPISEFSNYSPPGREGFFAQQSGRAERGGGSIWLLCVVMAALSKENGLAWAVVPPILAYAFSLRTGREAMRHLAVAMIVVLAYFAVYFIIYCTGIVELEYSGEYAQATIADRLKDFLQLMAYTWLPADYMSIVYPPTRNWVVAAMTVAMAMPFLLMLACKWRLFKSRRLPVLVACFFILVSPHLVTLISIMHNYAALSMAALIIAVIVSHYSNSRMISLAFALYLAAAVFTDVHHFQAARQSGLTGKKMALQVLASSEKPVERAFCINIDDESEPRYSNFCVRPVDAFAWGLSVRHYSHYKWKTAIGETTLPAYDSKRIESLADSALAAGNEQVWVVGRDIRILKMKDFIR